MNYFKRKRIAIMRLVEGVKGFVRTISGIPPITLPDCVDEDSLINYTISGNSVQNGEPTPENPVEVESVGEKTNNLIDVRAVYSSFPQYSELVEDGRNCIRFIDSAKRQYTDFEFKSLTQYTISFDCKTVKRSAENTLGSVLLRIFYDDGNVGNIYRPQNSDWYHATLTSAAGKTITAIGITAYNFTNWCYIDVDTFQIVEGTTEVEYEPYGKYKIPIKMSGNNLVRYPYADTTKMLNGLTFTDNEDGTITVNGTATANTIFNLRESSKSVWEGVEPNDTYTASLTLDGDYNGNITFNINYCTECSSSYSSWLTAQKDKATTKVCPANIAGIRSYIHITSGTVAENLVIKPQLEKGETASKFEPFVEPITTNIYLDEPLGLGEVLKYPKDNIPKLPTTKGTTIYSIETAVQPLNMSANYYSTSKGE